MQELREIPLFEPLSDEELADLSKVLISRTAKKNTHIIQANEEGNNLVVIKSGTVRVSIVNEEGKEVILAQLEKGDFFGELSILTGADRSADVVAVEDCELFMFQKADFEEHLATHVGLPNSLLRILAERLRQTSLKVSELALLDVYHRVSRQLERLAQTWPDGRLILDKRPTHQELASMTGTSREMVTRAMKKLEDDGMIEIDGKRVIIAE